MAEGKGVVAARDVRSAVVVRDDTGAARGRVGDEPPCVVCTLGVNGAVAG
jgi:hypothetical protein